MLEDTKSVDVRYIGDFLLVMSGTPITINGRQYYPQWYDTVYRVLQDIPEVKAALPTPVVVESDPTASYTEWSADVQARFHDVLTTPWTATDAQKQDYDAFITSQWQLTLKEAGVANAESLQGYDLLSAIVEYTKANHIHEISSLPFSLQLKIVSDGDNMVEYGLGQGLDPNKRESYYGYDWNASPHGTIDQMRQNSLFFFPTIHFYGIPIEHGQSESFNMITSGIEGDLVVRFDLQGVDPNISQGGLIRMVDQSGSLRYATVVLNYRATQTTKREDCVTASGNQLSGGVCAGGDSLKATTMRLVREPTNYKSVTRAALDDAMDQSDNDLHIAVYTWLGNGQLQNVFANGSAVVEEFEIGSDVKLGK